MKKFAYEIVHETPESADDAINLLMRQEFDFVLLDILLKGKWADNRVEDIWRLLRNYCYPVGFISGSMGDESAISTLNHLLEILRNNPHLGFFTYDNSIHGLLYTEDFGRVWALTLREFNVLEFDIAHL